MKPVHPIYKLPLCMILSFVCENCRLEIIKLVAITRPESPDKEFPEPCPTCSAAAKTILKEYQGGEK